MRYYKKYGHVEWYLRARPNSWLGLMLKQGLISTIPCMPMPGGARPPTLWHYRHQTYTYVWDPHRRRWNMNIVSCRYLSFICRQGFSLIPRNLLCWR